jgi:hypothetical protein
MLHNFLVEVQDNSQSQTLLNSLTVTLATSEQSSIDPTWSLDPQRGPRWGLLDHPSPMGGRGGAWRVGPRLLREGG